MNFGKPKYARSRAKQAGFTLIELMITVAIVAILARVAYASYQGSVVKTRRAKAKACLVEQAQFMERYYTTNFTYVSGDPTGLQCATEMASFYSFTTASLSVTGFTVEATPIGAQLSADTKCGKMTLNQAGAKTKSGTGTVSECW